MVGGLIAATTRALGRPVRGERAEFGDVVLADFGGDVGFCLGICLGATCAFVGTDGSLVRWPRNVVRIAWRV